MTQITPRWEWRSFGRRFGQAEQRLAGLTPSGVQESDELYLLSGAGGNVKIRDALMDIKVLREVNADGLEQWTPVMKAGFPLPAAEAAKVLEALGLPLPTPARASYTLDEFIAQFAAPGGAVRAVKVHKRRTRRLRHGVGIPAAQLRARRGAADRHPARARDPDRLAAVLRTRCGHVVRDTVRRGQETLARRPGEWLRGSADDAARPDHEGGHPPPRGRDTRADRASAPTYTSPPSRMPSRPHSRLAVQ